MLSTYYFPVQIAWSSRKLASLEDLKGQKIRATSPEQIEFLKRFGANGLTVGAPEVPSALERGVVDGVLTANAGGGKVWKDLLKYCYEIGLNFFRSQHRGEQGSLRQAAGELSRYPHQGGRRALAQDDAR